MRGKGKLLTIGNIRNGEVGGDQGTEEKPGTRMYLVEVVEGVDGKRGKRVGPVDDGERRGKSDRGGGSGSVFIPCDAE